MTAKHACVDFSNDSTKDRGKKSVVITTDGLEFSGYSELTRWYIFNRSKDKRAATASLFIIYNVLGVASSAVQKKKKKKI